MNVHVAEVAAGQDGLVTWRQLDAAGMSEKAIRCAIADLRELQDGVWLTGHLPPTDRQLWRAATLTTESSVLSHAAAADCYGWMSWDGHPTITRPGTTGVRYCGALVIHHSLKLDGWTTTTRDGIVITTPERTVIDRGAQLNDRGARKLIREALRSGLLTVARLQVALVAHRGRRGTKQLAKAAADFAGLQIEDTRSDAEAYALELLHAAGVQQPDVNKMIAGHEADLSWPEHRLIIEIDGPNWHQFFDDDTAKQAKWEAAGWTVKRIPSDDVYLHPRRLLGMAPPPTSRPAPLHRRR